jgi:hypothetical protein
VSKSTKTAVATNVVIVFGSEPAPNNLYAANTNGMLKHNAVIPIGKPSGNPAKMPCVR